MPNLQSRRLLAAALAAMLAIAGAGARHPATAMGPLTGPAPTAGPVRGAPVAAAPAAERRFTTTESAVHAAALASSRNLATLPAGLGVTVVARSGRWTRIRIGAILGWLPDARLAATTDVADPLAALPVLRAGSPERGYVRTVQRTVGVSADGIFGRATAAALIQWKLFNGLPGTATVGKGTWRRILSDHDGASPYPYPFVAAITPVTGGQPIERGRTGVKVKIVQRRLGFGAGTWESYDQATIRRVIAFQKRKGLRATGVVDKATWDALDTGYDWLTVDTYQARPRLAVTGVSAAQRIEAMIAYARAQRGAEYVWGGAGPKALGFDCSGFVLQALYAAGIDEQPIDVIKHSGELERTSQYLYNNVRTRHFRLAERRRGDLVFWMDRDNIVRHVAIYLGNGKQIEAVEPVVSVDPFVRTRGDLHVASFVVRPFR